MKYLSDLWASVYSRFVKPNVVTKLSNKVDAAEITYLHKRNKIAKKFHASVAKVDKKIDTVQSAVVKAAERDAKKLHEQKELALWQADRAAYAAKKAEEKAEQTASKHAATLSSLTNLRLQRTA